MTLPSGFTYIKNLVPTIREDIKYFTGDNFLGTKVRGYEREVAIATVQAAEALAKAQERFLKDGYSIIIFDAYRPQQAVDHFWAWANDIADTKMKERFYPSYDDKTKLFSDGFIARYSKHSRGSAIDMSVVNVETGELIDVGSEFDFFGPISFVENELINKNQQKSRLYLRDVMNDAGFDGYSKEWWHFELRNEPFTRKPEDHFNFLVK